MMQREFKILQRLGLHAKPSSMLVNEAGKFKSSVLVSKDGLEVNGKSIMGMMMLAAECGSSLLIKADGDDAEAAVAALLALVAAGFGED